MSYFASRDLAIMATFARKFYWSDLNLWPEDMPTGSVVLLSGNDELVHPAEIRVMLEDSNRDIRVSTGFWFVVVVGGGRREGDAAVSHRI